MSGEIRAILIAALLVVLAAGVGATVGQRARPTPTARPVPSPTAIALPSATPVDPAEMQRRAFAQPLAAGCATSRAVWLFADGGAAIRFDGGSWAMPDPTLRSITAADCDGTSVLAVGRGGSILTIDDEQRHVRVDRFGLEDLFAVSRFADPAPPRGALGQQAFAVGAAGTAAHQTDAGWQLAPTGVADDLNDVIHRGSGGSITFPLAWIVGAGGLSFRLMGQNAWERVPTGTTRALRSITFEPGGALAVGDGGTILRYVDGTASWVTVPSGADVDLRGVAMVGVATAWVVGGRGTVLELRGDGVKRVDLGTTCTLRDVFTAGSAIWVIGSDGTRGGAWRVAPGGTDRWGTC